MTCTLVPVFSLLLAGMLLVLVPGRRRWRRPLAAGIMVLTAAWLVSGWLEGTAGLPAAGFCRLLQLLVVLGGLGSLLLGEDDAVAPGREGLLLLAAAGACLVAQAGDLLSVAVALFACQLPLWAMAAASGERGREGALKALVLGMVALALAGAGAAIWLAKAGSIRLVDLQAFLQTGGYDPLGASGLALWLCGMATLLAAVPVHMWAVDFVEALPRGGAIFLIAGVMPAGVGALARVLLVGFGTVATPASGAPGWGEVLQVGGLVGLLLAGAVALGQQKLRRMFANLVAGQVGLVMVVLAAAGFLVASAPQLAERATGAVVFFLVIHVVTWMGLFLALQLVESGSDVCDISHLHGLAGQRPLLALVVGLALVCVAGMPPTAGFWARWLLLQALVDADLVTTAVVVALSLGLQLVMSLGLVTAMFRPGGAALPRKPATAGLLVVAWSVSLAMILVGLLPGRLVDLCLGTVSGLLGG